MLDILGVVTLVFRSLQSLASRCVSRMDYLLGGVTASPPGVASSFVYKAARDRYLPRADRVVPAPAAGATGGAGAGAGSGAGASSGASGEAAVPVSTECDSPAVSVVIAVVEAEKYVRGCCPLACRSSHSPLRVSCNRHFTCAQSSH